MKRTRISLKRLQEEADFINKCSNKKTHVSVHGTGGCGVFISINGELSKTMPNKKAYEELCKISKPLKDKLQNELLKMNEHKK